MKRAACIPILLVSALALVPGCTNKEGETEAPVFLTVSITSQPVVVDVGTVAPVVISALTVNSHLKNPTQTDPQGFAAVLLESYTVHFRRIDGGTRVPADLNLPSGAFVPSGGSASITNSTILPASMRQLSPFDQLLPFNGGFDRETGKDEIDMAFDITFFGHTVAGQRVATETAVGGPLQFRFNASASTSRNTR
jgi:hypothetical protein